MLSADGNESVASFNPSFRLDAAHLLQHLVDSDHDDELTQVTACHNIIFSCRNKLDDAFFQIHDSRIFVV